MSDAGGTGQIGLLGAGGTGQIDAASRAKPESPVTLFALFTLFAHRFAGATLFALFALFAHRAPDTGFVRCRGQWTNLVVCGCCMVPGASGILDVDVGRQWRGSARWDDPCGAS